MLCHTAATRKSCKNNTPFGFLNFSISFWILCEMFWLLSGNRGCFQIALMWNFGDIHFFWFTRMMNKYLKYFQHISISRQFLQSEKEYLHNHAVRAVQPTRLLLLKNYCTKGQLISKCLFGIFNSPEKRTKKIQL